jgi:TonB family protein
MTAEIAAANLVSFATQVAVLVGVGAALVRIFRIDAPKAMLAYWRALLAACLLLPFCQPWNRVESSSPPAVTASAASNTVTGATLVTEAPPAHKVRPAGEIGLLVLGAGIAVRLLWLMTGAYGLWRLRRRASPLEPLPESIQLAQDRTGVQARFYVTEDVSGPLTFGVLRPAIVIPPSVRDMPGGVQEAIACHELLHVRRRDWLYELLEEMVVTVLWFHPAIWLLIGRIRLAREQVVDAAVVELTASRERYVESLVAVARARLFPSLTPASPFLRRHLLRQRVARILQESTMTTRRLIASLAATGAALILTATFVVRSFPLEAQSRGVQASGEPVQLVAGADHLLHGERPEYPQRAIERNVEGDVIVDMTLNERGEVSDAHIVSGPEELRRVTLESVLQWHYSPAELRSTETQATLRFNLAAGRLVEDKRALEEEVVSVNIDKLTEHRRAEVEKALEDPALTDTQRLELKMTEAKLRAELEQRHLYRGDNVEFEVVPDNPEFTGSARLVTIRSERIPPEAAKELLQQAGVAVGDTITEDTAKRVQKIAASLDEHFRVEFHKEKGGVVMTMLAR